MIRIILIFFILCNITAYTQEFENYKPISLYNSSQSFEILRNKLANYNLIVIGEEHLPKVNVELQFELFKYLYSNDTVRHVLIEYGASRGVLINAFFKTGDIKILQRIWLGKDNSEFIIRMKLFYDSLPENNKFKVHGIDYEKGGIENVEYAILTIIDAISLNKIKLSERTLAFLDEYKGKDCYNGEAKAFIISFLSDLEKDTIKYRKEYGNYYEDLMAIYRALKVDVEGVKYKRNTFHPLREKREQLIYNQAVSLKEMYPVDKFYCIFGTAHIPLKSNNGWANFINFNPFISRLNTNNDSPFKGKIFSILPLYKSCIPPWKKHYAKCNIGLSRPQLDELDEKSKGNLFTLFECPNETDEQKKFRKEYYQMILINRF